MNETVVSHDDGHHDDHENHDDHEEHNVFVILVSFVGIGLIS